ncbi:MAG: PorV/PorQ family protein [Bacteroidia bacterium]
MYRLLFIISVIVLSQSAKAQLFPTFGNSRTGASGMQFLKIPHDARSTAMSGAVVGMINDPSALFWNPAGITGTDTATANFLLAHNRYFADTKCNMLGVTSKVGKLGYLGLSVVNVNYGQIDETTEFMPAGTGRQVFISNSLVGLTYAKILTEAFSFGLTAKWANEVIADVITNNVLFDLGLFYNIGLMHSRFGVSFSNFGLNVSPQGEVTILKFNGEQNIANFSSISAPGLFRIGAAFDPIHKGNNVLTVTAQLNHPTDNNETFAIGSEYGYKNTLFARGGWEFGSDERNLFPSTGIGIRLPRRFGNLRFDYSYVVKERIGNVNRISVQASLMSLKK